MRLAAPMAATTVTGTEIASAHGEAATRTTRARSIQVAGSPSRLPMMAMTAARTMIAGHQGLGDAVGQPLGVALAGLLGLDDVHDPGQGVVLGGGGDLDLQHSGAVDGAGVDGVPDPGLDRDGLAGEGGDVQGGAAGADDAVGGDPFAWPDQEQVADREVGGGHGDLGAVAQDGGLGRDQGEQRTQAAAGAGHRVLLQALADGVEEGERCGLGDLAEDDRADRGDRHQGADADLALGQPRQACWGTNVHAPSASATAFRPVTTDPRRRR